MTSLTSTAQGFERMLDLSRHLTRGLEAPTAADAATTRTLLRPALIAWMARVGERWARARAAEAWQELARHDRRMADELWVALQRAR
jgi:hypothetical protein